MSLRTFYRVTRNITIRRCIFNSSFHSQATKRAAEAPLAAVNKGQQIPQSLGELSHMLGSTDAHVVLRDACRCSRCVDPSTQQRDFNYADIPVDIHGTLAEHRDGRWRVHWANDIPGYKDHVSTYTHDQIKRLTSTPRSQHATTTMLWDKDAFKRETKSVSYDEYMNDEAGLAKVLYLFARHGLVFLTGVPREENSVSTIAERIAPLRNTFYGGTWNVRSVPDSRNVAYTSKHLGFHMDLLYMKESPTVQFLNCLENSCTGGESRFVDTFKAYDVLCSEHPELARVLSQSRIRYEYDNDGQYYSDVKAVVSHKQSMEFPRRQIRGNQNEEVSTVSRVYWSPPFVGSIQGALDEPSEIVQQKLQASKAFADIFERPDLVYEEKMEPGTCMIFDNLRVLHARNAFDMNSGKRWLMGCYLDGQDILSKEISLSSRIQALDWHMDEHGSL